MFTQTTLFVSSFLGLFFAAGVDETILVSCVNVGNPVACIFTGSLDFDWHYVGREMESHAAFPERANIVSVKVHDRQNIKLRIWERGVGETSGSGTCSAGAAVLCSFTGRTGRNFSVHTLASSPALFGAKTTKWS